MRPSSERKRSAVLAAAQRRFVADGFDGVTLDDVAADAGVAKQTLYSHFGSKEQLFVEVVQTATAEVFTTLHPDDELPPDREALERYLIAVAGRQLDGVLAPQVLALRRLAVAESRRFPELGRSFFEGGAERTVGDLADRIARWVALGLLTAPDAGRAASLFNWLLLGEPVNRAMLLGDAGLHSVADREAHAAEVVRVFLAAYG